MKTIAIMIDEETVQLIDELHGESSALRSRSALIRAAIREYVTRLQRQLEEERERVRKNKDLLDKQLKALVEQQGGVV